MAARSAPRDHMPHAIGMVQTAQRIGPAVGPVAGGILGPLVGLRSTFIVSSVVYAVAFVLLTVMYKEPSTASRKTVRPDMRVAFRNILAFENFLLLMAVIFGLQLVDRSFGPVLPLHLDELGYQNVSLLAGILFSVLALAGALGHQLAAVLLKRMSARMVIAMATLTGAGAFAAFAASSAMWALAPSMALAGLSLGTAMTAAFSAAGAVIPVEAHGASFGFLTSASLIGSAVSPVLSGLAGVRSFRIVFVGGAIIMAVLALAVQRVMVDRNLQIESTPQEEG
jgi:MFS family permease